ncbi:MAG: sugar nucleotide-binding protein [Candidatus Paceibacterota bacterium]|jgi:dTDP-4-dehydrorhamnose reductase
MRIRRVAIISPTGMLGNGVYQVLKDKYKLVLIYRDEDKIKLLDENYGGVKQHSLIKFDLNLIYDDFSAGFSQYHLSPSLKSLYQKIGEIDAVINCAGIINRHMNEDVSFGFFLNSVFSYLLSEYYQEKLIHITTDCVFSGQEGYPYSESSPKSPQDLYGASKMLGEPKEKSLVLRTSIIGREISGLSSLLEWFLQQKSKTIHGFANHFWNGITTKQFGKICDEIISHPEEYPKTGLYHIFSTTISKHKMLLKFEEKYNIDCKIISDDSSFCNRTLTTIHDFNKKLNIPSFDEMLKELL